MPNSYSAVGSISTVTASVTGGGPELNDGDRSVPAMSAGEVTRRLLSYVRPHAGSFALSFVAAAVSVTLQLYVPILIGQGIDLIVTPSSSTTWRVPR